MVTFLGTAAACTLLAVSSLFRWYKPGARYLLAGRLLYLAGTVLVTIVCHVPRNDTLKAVDPASADGASRRAGSIVRWTVWNHVRTAAALATAVSHTLALGR
jgi:uncharacterized membrane protein